MTQSSSIKGSKDDSNHEDDILPREQKTTPSRLADTTPYPDLFTTQAISVVPRRCLATRTMSSTKRMIGTAERPILDHAPETGRLPGMIGPVRARDLARNGIRPRNHVRLVVV
jgi:hypothetical protein